MANTTKGYPYPIDTDSADVPSDVQLLAEAVDASPGIASLTQTQIDALSAGMKWAGRVVWNQTTNKLQRSDGSSFVDLVLTSDSRLTDARTPSAHASSHGSAGSDPITIAQSQVTDLSSALAAKAPTASPTFTGTVTMTGATVKGAGLDFVKAQSFSAVSSVIVSGAFATDWENYRVILDMRTCAVSGGVNAQMRSGGTTVTSGYRGQRFYAQGTTLTGSTSGTGSFDLGYINTTYPDFAPFQFEVMAPFLAIPTKVFSANLEDTGAARTYNQFAMNLNTSGSYTDLVLNFPGSSTGNVLIYGYRKA